MRKIASLALGAALLLLPSAASHAASINFTAGNVFRDNLGNDGSVSTDFDRLTLTGRSFVLDIDAGIPETNIISDLLFQVGNTGPASPGTYNFTASYSVTADGSTGTIAQPFTLIIGSPTDTLTLLSAPSVTLDLGASGALTISASGTGPFVSSGTRQATVSALFTLSAPTAVPEPTTFALVGVALGILGLLRRRNNT